MFSKLKLNIYHKTLSFGCSWWEKMQARIQSWKKVTYFKLHSLDQFTPMKVFPVTLIQQDFKITDRPITLHFINFSNSGYWISSFRSCTNTTLAQSWLWCTPVLKTSQTLFLKNALPKGEQYVKKWVGRYISPFCFWQLVILSLVSTWFLSAFFPLLEVDRNMLLDDF